MELLLDLLRELAASVSLVGSQLLALLPGAGEAGRKHTAQSAMEVQPKGSWETKFHQQPLSNLEAGPCLVESHMRLCPD